MQQTDNYKILARLAEEDINIFNAHQEGGQLVIEYEYGWHPTQYKTKWTKAIYMVDYPIELGTALRHILAEVQAIRGELR